MNRMHIILAALTLIGGAIAALAEEIVAEGTAAIRVVTPWESCSTLDCENSFPLDRVRVECQQFDGSLGVLTSVRVELVACGNGVMNWEHPGDDDIGGFATNTTFGYELDGPGISPDLQHSLRFPDRSGTVTPSNRQGQLVWGNTCRTSGRVEVSSASWGSYIGNGTISLTIDPTFSYFMAASGGIDELFYFYDFTSAMTARVIYEFTACPADFNRDGRLNTQDVTAFLNAYTAGDSSADFNGDGSINSLDVLAFLNAWTAGC